MFHTCTLILNKNHINPPQKYKNHNLTKYQIIIGSTVIHRSMYYIVITINIIIPRQKKKSYISVTLCPSNSQGQLEPLNVNFNLYQWPVLWLWFYTNYIFINIRMKQQWDQSQIYHPYSLFFGVFFKENLTVRVIKIYLGVCGRGVWSRCCTLYTCLSGTGSAPGPLWRWLDRSSRHTPQAGWMHSLWPSQIKYDNIETKDTILNSFAPISTCKRIEIKNVYYPQYLCSDT